MDILIRAIKWAGITYMQPLNQHLNFMNFSSFEEPFVIFLRSKDLVHILIKL